MLTERCSSLPRARLSTSTWACVGRGRAAFRAATPVRIFRRSGSSAHARGVSAFANGQMVLLASLGLDLKSANIRAALLETHHRGEIRPARLDNPGAARVALDARGLRPKLVDESIISDGDSIFHAVELP